MSGAQESPPALTKLVTNPAILGKLPASRRVLRTGSDYQHHRATLSRTPMSPLQKLVAIKKNWESYTRSSLRRYEAMMTQVEALRVEVSALEMEIRRTESSDLPPAHKNARIRGLASRASESYGQMLCVLRQAGEAYPALLNRPLEIPHTFSRRERERLIYLPERPPAFDRREVGVIIAMGAGLVMTAMLLSEFFPVLSNLPTPR
jgi:hypothetical protein